MYYYLRDISAGLIYSINWIFTRHRSRDLRHYTFKRHSIFTALQLCSRNNMMSYPYLSFLTITNLHLGCFSISCS